MNLPENALVVLCGPSGSGKSTFAKRHFLTSQVISSDRLRAMVSDDEADQQASAAAFYLLRALLRFRLERGRLTVVDSTALRPKSRHQLLHAGNLHGVSVVAVLFDVPFETCEARNANRERSVPRDVLEQQFRLFKRALEAIPAEGFDQVITLKSTGDGLS